MTYKGLINEYFKRGIRLNRIAKTEGANAPFPHWINVMGDEVEARRENSELYDYQLRRAYPRERSLF